MIIRDWTWDQWKAAGGHGLTAVSASLATAVTFGLLSQADASSVATNIAIIVESAGKISVALAGLITTFGGVYAALRAANSAKPENQAKATVRALDNGLPLNGERKELIRAIAEQPDVQKVELRDKALAEQIPTPKVQ